MVEISFCIAFLILVFSLFIQSLELTFMLPNGLISSGFFPTILSIIIMVLLVLYILELLIKRKKGQQSKETFSKEVVWKQIFVIAAMSFSLWLVQVLGMIFTIGLFLMSALVLVENMKWFRSAVFSVGSMLCIYLIFVVWLGMRIP